LLSLPVSYVYWIVCPKATTNLPKIGTFREWLLAEAAEDARRLREIAPVASRRPAPLDDAAQSAATVVDPD
jgi:LysR family transcriptional regulator, glycine cleavage system transcriptional activator